MSCCEHEIYKRKKDLQHMLIIGKQIASISNQKQVVVERIHGRYGKYFEIIPQKETGKEHVLFVIEPLPAVEFQPSTKPRKHKSVSDRRKSDGD